MKLTHHRVLKNFNLNGAIVYFDDTVISGRDVDGFLGILYQILPQMAKINVWLKPSNFFWYDINQIPGSCVRYQD